jgi:peptidoglycan-associated lipoprotein
MKNVALLAILSLAVAACGTTEVKRADAPAATPPAQAAAPSPTSRASPAASAPIAANPLKDPNNVLSKRSVFFAFDDSAVAAEDQKLLQAHGRYLGENRALKVRIEGNCDERGSREYNLALGQRRAQAAKNVLKVVGVDDSRVETISYGEDKPMATGHDEAAWARNRRADLKYPGE